MAETANDILQKMIGELVFQIATLENRVQEAVEKNADLEKRLSAFQEKFGALE